MACTDTVRREGERKRDDSPNTEPSDTVLYTRLRSSSTICTPIKRGDRPGISRETVGGSLDHPVARAHLQEQHTATLTVKWSAPTASCCRGNSESLRSAINQECAPSESTLDGISWHCVSVAAKGREAACRCERRLPQSKYFTGSLIRTG